MTQQSSEVLKAGDEKLFMHEGVYPLEAYIGEPDNYKGKDWGAGKYFNITALSTAEHRGYCGYWEIKNNALYFTGIFAYHIRKKGFWFWKKYEYPEASVTDLFPEAVNGEIKATWFTGKFSSYTKTTKNPVDDRLWLNIKNGEVIEYQWYHLESNSRFGGVAFEKRLL